MLRRQRGTVCGHFTNSQLTNQPPSGQISWGVPVFGGVHPFEIKSRSSRSRKNVQDASTNKRSQWRAGPGAPYAETRRARVGRPRRQELRRVPVGEQRTGTGFRAFTFGFLGPCITLRLFPTTVYRILQGLARSWVSKDCHLRSAIGPNVLHELVLQTVGWLAPRCVTPTEEADCACTAAARRRRCRPS